MPSNALLGLVGTAGVLTHVLYFNKSEHHFYGVRYLQLAVVTLCTAIAGLVRIGDETFTKALITAISVEGTYLAGVFTSLLIYRAFFNPLNKLPGPFLARKSGRSLCSRWKRAAASYGG